jgi:hypothetical protein
LFPFAYKKVQREGELWNIMQPPPNTVLSQILK